MPTLDPDQSSFWACVYPLNASRHHHHFSVVCLHFLMKYPFSFPAHLLSRGSWGIWFPGLRRGLGLDNGKTQHTHTKGRNRIWLFRHASVANCLSSHGCLIYIVSVTGTVSNQIACHQSGTCFYTHRALFLLGAAATQPFTPLRPLGGSAVSRPASLIGIGVTQRRPRDITRHEATRHEEELLLK
jgi:hypothetical protein